MLPKVVRGTKVTGLKVESQGAFSGRLKDI